MESRCKAGVIMASTRGGGGVGLRGDGVQVLGYRGFLMVVLLFVTVTTFVIEDVHCSISTDAVVAPAPTPSTQQTEAIVTFNQYEADALNAVFKTWSKQNPQLSTLLNWSLEQHPCNNLTGAFEDSTGNDFQGAWNGVGCTSVLQNLTEIPKNYHIFVTSLEILGSNYSCESFSSNYNQCGFDGIIGQLPLEISNLTNLQSIKISQNPKLTGPVPVGIFQLPYLSELDLNNNSLNGTLPSDVYNADCKLEWIYLNNNNFSGSLRVSSQRTLFSSSLKVLRLDYNQLDGPIDFQDWNVTQAPSLYLNNNCFKGTFSTGPYFDVQVLILSNNNLTRIRFANYIGPIKYTSLGTICMPSLFILDLSMNNFFGSIDFRGLNAPMSLEKLYINNNNFNGTFFTSAYFNPYFIDLSNNQFNIVAFHEDNETTFSNGSFYMSNLEEIYFQNNNLRGQFPASVLTAPSLKLLDASQNQYETLQLPNVRIENSRFSQIFITNNNLRSVTYSTTGPFTSYNLQYSSFFFIGGNPICDKIENPSLSSTCRLSRLDQAPPVIQRSNAKIKVIIATSTTPILVSILLVTTIYVWRLMGRIKALHNILEEFE